MYTWASQVALVVKNPPANVGDKRFGFDPWVGKIPWRKAWQPTPVRLPGEFHRQRSLAGYSPRGRRVKQLRTHAYTLHTRHLCPASKSSSAQG